MSECYDKGERVYLREILDYDRLSREDSRNVELVPLSQLDPTVPWVSGSLDQDTLDLPTLVCKDYKPAKILPEFLLHAGNEGSSNLWTRLVSEFPGLGGLNLEGIFIAGGAVSSVLTNGCCNDDKQDVDIFLYGMTPDAANWKAQSILRHIVKRLRSESREAKGFLQVKQEIRPTSFNIIVGGQRPRTYQIILRIYETMGQIPLGFDLGSSAVGLGLASGAVPRRSSAEAKQPDPITCYTTRLGQACLEKAINILDWNRCSPSYWHRLKKYLDRGYAIVLPELNMSRFSEYLEMSKTLTRLFASGGHVKRIRGQVSQSIGNLIEGWIDVGRRDPSSCYVQDNISFTTQEEDKAMARDAQQALGLGSSLVPLQRRLEEKGSDIKALVEEDSKTKAVGDHMKALIKGRRRTALKAERVARYNAIRAVNVALSGGAWVDSPLDARGDGKHDKQRPNLLRMKAPPATDIKHGYELMKKWNPEQYRFRGKLPTFLSRYITLMTHDDVVFLLASAPSGEEAKLRYHALLDKQAKETIKLSKKVETIDGLLWVTSNPSGQGNLHTGSVKPMSVTAEEFYGVFHQDTESVRYNLHCELAHAAHMQAMSDSV